jgi:hypothetical protein
MAHEMKSRKIMAGGKSLAQPEMTKRCVGREKDVRKKLNEMVLLRLEEEKRPRK